MYSRRLVLSVDERAKRSRAPGRSDVTSAIGEAQQAGEGRRASRAIDTPGLQGGPIAYGENGQAPGIFRTTNGPMDQCLLEFLTSAKKPGKQVGDRTCRAPEPLRLQSRGNLRNERLSNRRILGQALAR
jgi:hypothetical protein